MEHDEGLWHGLKCKQLADGRSESSLVQLLGELRVWLTVGASAIQNLWVLAFLSINQGRMVLTTRYLGYYSVPASQVPLEKWILWTLGAMRLNHYCMCPVPSTEIGLRAHTPKHWLSEGIRNRIACGWRFIFVFCSRVTNDLDLPRTFPVLAPKSHFLAKASFSGKPRWLVILHSSCSPCLCFRYVLGTMRLTETHWTYLGLLTFL